MKLEVNIGRGVDSQLSNPDELKELMDKAAYDKFCKEADH